MNIDINSLRPGDKIVTDSKKIRTIAKITRYSDFIKLMFTEVPNRHIFCRYDGQVRLLSRVKATSYLL